MPQRPNQLPSFSWVRSEIVDARARGPDCVAGVSPSWPSMEMQRAVTSAVGGSSKRAVIGERDVVQIFTVVVGIEGAEAAIRALQPLDPFARARDRVAMVRCAVRPPARGAVHRHRDDGGVVEIGIMRIGILKRPAARPHMRAFAPPSRPRRR